MARMNWLLAGLMVASAATGCAYDTGDTGGSTESLAIDFDADRAVGTFTHEDGVVVFDAEMLPEAMEVTLEFNGMVLTMTSDRISGAFDLDGYTAETGEETQIVEDDIALLRAFEAGLAETYLAHASESPAVDLLNRSLTLWGQYSTVVPLTRTFLGRLDRSSSLCGNVNRPGQGVNTKRWQSATHDCGSTAGDCSNWIGCERWDDNATTSNVFMSMHPEGGCSDDTYFGGSSTGFSCYEPNHPGGTEYAYGACFGRCGGSCGSGTAFTRDCLDHDHCVRFGHGIASGWCGDELVGATWDAINASNCSNANFGVDYNWANTGSEGSCPTSWNGTNDGCDVGCQFIDGDCFR